MKRLKVVHKVKRPEAAVVLAAFLMLGSGGERHEEQVRLDLSLGTPVMLAGKRNTAYLKIGLAGFDRTDGAQRARVNLAIVLDRSGSMAGEKLEKAKEAASMILDRLGGDDVVSVVAYDTFVQVLVPATKVSDRNREGIRSKIKSIRPAGSTALFAGVSRGIEEVRKFLDQERFNRVILLSDGQANVGPSSPNELGRLGAACAKEGISITTIGLGLGYNEDLMTQLATKSDGNHGFAENASGLTKMFDAELGDVLSVVAQEVAIKVTLADGLRPVRSLNREAEIQGQTVILRMNQLYAKQEKYFLVEVEVPPRPVGGPSPFATADVSYANLISGRTDRLHRAVEAAFSASQAEVEARTDQSVMVAAVEAIATEKNRLAVTLRDEGKVGEAQHVLIDNSSYLKVQAQKYKSKKLEDYGNVNFEDANNLDERNWVGRRKIMRTSQHKNETQQSY